MFAMMIWLCMCVGHDYIIIKNWYTIGEQLIGQRSREQYYYAFFFPKKYYLAWVGATCKKALQQWLIFYISSTQMK